MSEEREAIEVARVPSAKASEILATWRESLRIPQAPWPLLAWERPVVPPPEHIAHRRGIDSGIRMRERFLDAGKVRDEA
jgi:hypothetical protein